MQPRTWAPACALLAACASPIPDRLAPAGDQVLTRVVAARGVQIYECRAAAGQAPAWVFVAPEAMLFDGDGKLVGQHGAGPHWQATDGSRIVGQLRERADAPQAGAIPWLLLAAASAGPQGAFSAVTSVQRIHTAGGTAPADGCDASHTGAQARVAYSADYRFFSPR